MILDPNGKSPEGFIKVPYSGFGAYTLNDADPGTGPLRQTMSARDHSAGFELPHPQINYK